MAGYLYKLSWSILRSSCSYYLIVFADGFFVSAHGRDVIASGPKVVARIVPFSAVIFSCDMYRAFAFYVPYDLRNCILGQYGDKHMRMIGNEIPSNISHSRLCASSLNTDPNCCRNSLYRRFFRYFGIHVTWYLHSHFVWLKLWLSFIESLSFVNFERFTLWGAFISLRNCQTLGVHRHSR